MSVILLTYKLAGGQGIEPRLTVSKTAVLPLDEPPIGEPGGNQTPIHCFADRSLIIHAPAQSFLILVKLSKFGSFGIF